MAKTNWLKTWMNGTTRLCLTAENWLNWSKQLHKALFKRHETKEIQVFVWLYSRFQWDTHCLPVEHFLWLLMPVRLETTGHDHFTEPAAPRGWSQSFPFWPAVCACPARARRFLFGFLQEWVTFAMEDFVWSVASARAVIHSFLFLLHTDWRAESPSEDSHEVEEGLSDRKSNMLLEIYSIIFSKSIPLPREVMPRSVTLCRHRKIAN